MTDPSERNRRHITGKCGGFRERDPVEDGPKMRCENVNLFLRGPQGRFQVALETDDPGSRVGRISEARKVSKILELPRVVKYKGLF